MVIIMQYMAHPHIKTESDLLFYEKYLQDNISSALPKKEASASLNLREYLKNAKGKLIKVELFFQNRLESKIGFLSEAGDDFIVIMPRNSSLQIVIKQNNIKYITLIGTK